MNLEPNDDNYKLVLSFGSYFYPANKRYYPESIVQCDRCLRNHLTTCIGFLNLDLCLTCAHQVESLLPDIEPYFPKQD